VQATTQKLAANFWPPRAFNKNKQNASSVHAGKTTFVWILKPQVLENCISERTTTWLNSHLLAAPMPGYLIGLFSAQSGLELCNSFTG
jgi:hypothetical protein